MFEHNTVTNNNNNKDVIVYASKFTSSYGYHNYILKFDSPHNGVK